MNGKLAGKVASGALVLVIDSRGGAASSGTGRQKLRIPAWLRWINT